MRLVIFGYEDRIYLHIIPNIGDIPLDQLPQNDLKTFYGKIKKSGRLQYVDKFGTGLSDRTIILPKSVVGVLAEYQKTVDSR